jgi:hypothetical protein
MNGIVFGNIMAIVVIVAYIIYREKKIWDVLLKHS